MNRPSLVGRDPVFKATVALARRIAGGRSPALLLGPTGSGKSLLARALHGWGPHAREPFVEWHAGAVPESLLEADLFGVHRGVATGVHERSGLFESAGRGTVCLAGIEHLPSHQQAGLLRVLERQEYERIGGGSPVKSEARVLAVFQEAPEALVARGVLRADLLYRLDVIRLELPPLSQRRGDIPLLAKHFLRAACVRQGIPAPALSEDLLNALEAHTWPGNLRELAQLMDLLSLSGGDPIGAEFLPASFWHGATTEALDRRLSLAEMKDAYIRAVLAQVGGNRSQAARWLGISRKALWAHLRRGLN